MLICGDGDGFWAHGVRSRALISRHVDVGGFPGVEHVELVEIGDLQRDLSELMVEGIAAEA